jgi:hypothetical protein
VPVRAGYIVDVCLLDVSSFQRISAWKHACSTHSQLTVLASPVDCSFVLLRVSLHVTTLTVCVSALSAVATQGGSTGYKGAGNKADLDNHANQLNPNNPAHQGSGGQQQRK